MKRTNKRWSKIDAGHDQERGKNRSGPDGFPEANSGTGPQEESCRGIAVRHVLSVYVTKGLVISAPLSTDKNDII